MIGNETDLLEDALKIVSNEDHTNDIGEVILQQRISNRENYDNFLNTSGALQKYKDENFKNSVFLNLIRK